MKRILYIVTLTLIMSCGPSKEVIDNNSVNSKPNKQYRQSIEGHYGSMNTIELKEFYNNITTETNRTIDTKKIIFIEFIQKGENCFMEKKDLTYYDKKTIMNNSDRNITKAKNLYNIEAISVFTKDSYANDYLSNNSSWHLDTGFFQTQIFISKQNCEAFLLIRPDGSYYKYYGFDYYTIVKDLLENEDWDMKK